MGRKGFTDFIEAGLLAAGSRIEHESFHRLCNPLMFMLPLPRLSERSGTPPPPIGTCGSLRTARDLQFANSIGQRRPFHSKSHRCSAGPPKDPVGLPESTEDVVPFRILESTQLRVHTLRRRFIQFSERSTEDTPG